MGFLIELYYTPGNIVQWVSSRTMTTANYSNKGEVATMASHTDTGGFDTLTFMHTAIHSIYDMHYTSPLHALFSFYNYWPNTTYTMYSQGVPMSIILLSATKWDSKHGVPG